MKDYTYCICQYNDEPDTLYVAELFVPKDKRKNGLGDKAIQEAEMIAKAKGAKWLKLSVRRWSWKYDWYKRKGFHPFCTKTFIVWMEKEIK